LNKFTLFDKISVSIHLLTAVWSERCVPVYRGRGKRRGM